MIKLFNHEIKLLTYIASDTTLNIHISVKGQSVKKGIIYACRYKYGLIFFRGRNKFCLVQIWFLYKL